MERARRARERKAGGVVPRIAPRKTKARVSEPIIIHELTAATGIGATTTADTDIDTLAATIDAQTTGAGDIVITGDIPLAARCLERGARVLGHKGREFTESNIGDALATRHLLTQLRDQGTMMGGPPPFKKKDRSLFLQQLE